MKPKELFRFGKNKAMNEDELYSRPNSFLIGDSLPQSNKIAYRKGDIIVNVGPTCESEPLYKCIESGNPGTWIVIGSGSKGEAGPQGPQGEKGDKGDPGAIYNVKGTIENDSAASTLDVTTAEIGDCYIAEDSKNVFMFNGTEFINLGPISGPQGEKGDKGDPGEAGPKGEQGDQGPAGIFDDTYEYTDLKTKNKKMVAAMNELFDMIGKSSNTEKDPEPTGDVMYYGFIPYSVSGSIEYEDVTKELLQDCANTVKQVAPGVMDRTSTGQFVEGDMIIVAFPAASNLVAYKDNGLNSKVKFDGTGVPCVNGLDLDIGGVPYKVYGEMMLVSGELFIYVDKA